MKMAKEAHYERRKNVFSDNPPKTSIHFCTRNQNWGLALIYCSPFSKMISLLKLASKAICSYWLNLGHDNFWFLLTTVYDMSKRPRQLWKFYFIPQIQPLSRICIFHDQKEDIVKSQLSGTEMHTISWNLGFNFLNLKLWENTTCCSNRVSIIFRSVQKLVSSELNGMSLTLTLKISIWCTNALRYSWG